MLCEEEKIPIRIFRQLSDSLDKFNEPAAMRNAVNTNGDEVVIANVHVEINEIDYEFREVCQKAGL